MIMCKFLWIPLRLCSEIVSAFNIIYNIAMDTAIYKFLLADNVFWYFWVGNVFMCLVYYWSYGKFSGSVSEIVLLDVDLLLSNKYHQRSCQHPCGQPTGDTSYRPHGFLLGGSGYFRTYLLEFSNFSPQSWVPIYVLSSSKSPLWNSKMYIELLRMYLFLFFSCIF